MKTSRWFAIAAVLGVGVFCLTSPASASSLNCTVPTSTTLSVLPVGCAAVLTNGPITFTNVHGSDNHQHNVEIDSLLLSGINPAAFSVHVSVQGIDHDTTANTNTAFSRSVTSNFETSLEQGAFAPDNAPHTFDILHFINDFGGGVIFKLNFGELLPAFPSQQNLDKVTSSANTLGAPGFFTVTSFFDVFTELSLDGGFSNPNGTWKLADNDFTANGGTGTGAIFELQNIATPEPASMTLLASGLLVAARRRRNRASR